ncbi:Hypothetical protein R9X50_00130100 [Acrodontium crateriforme]|uniref:MAGE domain-containing protein n=1 Tax=Acrodontium crateriforme TaxID=150365 RepID=A0AAQ3M291_9PEZI|nr:Hypothetical protein R9X50_00130100 [Acrodontium crateriforme]
MPLVRGHKRRAQPEEDIDAPSPEPATQRRRASPPEPENEVDGDNDGGYRSDTLATQGNSTLEQLVKKMVRFALACEYQRRPIRRTEISEKVLVGGTGRQFKNVFAQAQVELRRVFGMEMIELPAREKVTVAQRRAAQKTAASQSQTKTAASWVLISVLPSQFKNPEIIGPAAIPSETEESKYAAIYTLLISLISLHGGQLPDSKWERYLRRLNIIDTTPVEGYDRTDKLIKRLEKDGYIIRIKERAGPGDEDIYWIVGPRGKVEVGDDGIRGLLTSVYGELDDEKEKDLDRRFARSMGLTEKAPKRPEAEQAQQTQGTRPAYADGEGEEGQDDEDGEGSDDE